MLDGTANVLEIGEEKALDPITVILGVQAPYLPTGSRDRQVTVERWPIRARQSLWPQVMGEDACAQGPSAWRGQIKWLALVVASTSKRCTWFRTQQA